MKEFPIHPASAVLPMMSAERIKELADDIRQNGLQKSVELYDGQIIDGRNRLAACHLLGIEPSHIDVTDRIKDPRAYVASVNLQRRDLTIQQRAACAAELATMPWGGERGNQYTSGKVQNCTLPENEGLSLQAAADLAGVSRRTVAAAKKRMKTDPAAHRAAKEGRTPRRKRKKSTPKTTAYSWINIAFEMGLLPSPKSGGQSQRFKLRLVELGMDEADINDPTHESELRSLLARIVSEEIEAAEIETRTAAAVAVEREAFKEGQRERFDKAVRRAAEAVRRQLEATYWKDVDKEVRGIVGKQTAALADRERELKEWAANLTNRERDITTYMTEAEFRAVLGCLHPDRPERAEAQLNKAFTIFSRLESYIVRVPPTVRRARGWE